MGIARDAVTDDGEIADAGAVRSAIGSTRSVRMPPEVVVGMLARACSAILFVPAFFVMLQRLGERRTPAVTAPPGAV